MYLCILSIYRINKAIVLSINGAEWEHVIDLLLAQDLEWVVVGTRSQVLFYAHRMNNNAKIA